jgi:two-component system response regulator FixJ
MASASMRTIFVVDDDDVVRDSLNALLGARQYDVIEFDSGRAFLDRSPTLAAGCLLLDVHMPDMTGIDLLKTLREQGNAIPTIIMTGRKDPGIEADARALGVVAVLDKPVTHTVLFAAIEQALAS